MIMFEGTSTSVTDSRVKSTTSVVLMVQSVMTPSSSRLIKRGEGCDKGDKGDSQGV